MDYQVGTWLLVIHLTAFLPAQTFDISVGDSLWSTHNSKQGEDSAHRLHDVASPRRLAITGDSTSPLSDHYLKFTERRHSHRVMRYNLTAFGVEYQLILRPDRRFIAPSFTVEHFSGNRSVSIPCGSDLSHCYYRGRVLGDPVSSAVFDLCNGLRGAFKTRNRVYFVQPLDKTSTTPGQDTVELNGKPHLVTDYLATLKHAANGSHCGVDEKLLSNRPKPVDDNPNLHSLPQLNNPIHRRAKRETIFQGAQSYPRYVEMMLTADKSMLDHYGSEFELKRYLQTIVGVVHDIFLDPKIGNSIEVVLTGIKILKHNKDLEVTSDARESLRRFCVWQHKQNVESDADAGHYDTAVLITRKDICRGKDSCDTLGLAELGTMCDPARSCSIVEDGGMGVAFTIAHELGHVFNVVHDVMSKKCLGEKNGLQLMAPALNLQSIPWSWSSCSRKEITEFLDRGHDKCLMDKPQYQFKRSDKLPGEVYSVDEQCKLTYGKKSSLCRFKIKSCRRLWCAVKTTSGQEVCHTHAMPWAEGSPCENGMWCIRGACVPRHKYVQVNGCWSAWTPFGPCSRTCGGGVAYSTRHCNNPSPSYGGKFCLGTKTRFKSCQTHECAEGSASFRAVQCAAYNGKKGSKDSKWVPRYLKGRHQCRLVCERVGGGGFVTSKVIDGTKCDENQFDICVNGICRLAGCDNVLNSKAKVDQCGVCSGDNTTCERQYKTWHKKVEWGYNKVTTFYPGFSSLRIEQTTPKIDLSSLRQNGDDYNYLALLDENYNNIINSGFVVTQSYGVTHEAGGLEITYSGSQTYPEFIKIDGKLTKKIYLQVLSIERVLPPKITYSYIRPIKAPEKYIWDKKGAWSKCSHDCQGFRRRLLVCKRERDGLLVSTLRCDAKNRPRTTKENCHTQCLFKWMVNGKGTCQPGCGPGSQKIYYKCVKHDIKSGANLVQSNKYCKFITKPRSDQPCTGRCDNVQWVYSKWNDCSKTCGGGTQFRKVTCVEKISYVRKELPASTCSRIKKRHLQRTCNTERCPSWRTGRWARCSAACGEGTQRRRVACLWKGNKVAKDTACDVRRKPKEKQNCRLKACPHWEYGVWSDCSVTCGAGLEVRLIRCVDAEGKALPDKHCPALEKPISRRNCSGLPQCDKTVFLTSKVTSRGKVKWAAGDWGECSSECGVGNQERQLSCVDSKERVLNNVSCKNVTKPVTIQECFRYCGYWRYSDWTPCSSGCGRGTQRRQVKCFNKEYRLTEDKMCDPLVKPTNIRQCYNYYCSPAQKPKPKSSGRWKTGTWTKCSKTCESGIKRRNVICLDGSSNKDSSQKSCKKITKPESVTSCNLGSCPQWKAKQWTRCSRTCNLGIKRRSVVCLDGSSKKDSSQKICKNIAKPESVISCNLGPCPQWTAQQWSQCSKTCGLGTVSRKVYCSTGSSILGEDKCNKKLKPTVKKSCFVKTCVTPSRWVKGKWNPCSVKCGQGLKKRQVWCEDLRGKQISSINCRGLRRKPKSVKICRRNTCGIWETGPWGDCSSKCDVGERVRNVRCRRTSSFVADEFCPWKDRPSDKESCQIGNCKSDQYRWFTTGWSQCSKSCGFGVKSRMVICINETEIQVAKSNCNQNTKPPETVMCQTKECLPEWTIGDWSECSKSCSEGVETRTVSCPKNDSESNELCDKKKKPDHQRRCNRGICNSFIWKTGPWSRCSATCGEAGTRRAVKCLGRYNYYRSDAMCVRDGIIKPDNYKKCKLSPCLPKRCKDIQIQMGKQDDKEFFLTINNKKMKVFCYGMLSDNPKEFITLRSGSKSNFAEYFHRSLKNPNECPYNGARNDNCPHCHTELFPSSGGSYFSKVRLDISRMSLVGNDFTFAVKRGKHAPTFGTAGDCYSKKQCPQGRFSIDLTDTGFSLAREVTWRSYGYHLSRIIDIHEGRQIVSGMCGGYCGVCRPYRSLKITV